MIKPSAERGDVVAYDFRRPSRISPDRQRNLEASHEQMAQALQRWVSGRLRSSIEVHLETVSQVRYRDFLESLADPCITYLYDITQKPGASLAVQLEPGIAFLLLEKLLGGSDVTPPPDRPMSALESVIIRIVTDRIASEVMDVWRDQVALKLEYSRFETARELVEMTGRDDDVLLTTLRLTFEEQSSMVQFLLPFTVLEPFLNASASARSATRSSTQAERATELGQIETTVRRASVDVSARIGSSRLTLESLAGLSEGDLLPVEISAEDPVEVLVSGTKRYLGRQGRLGQHLGIEITDTVN